MSEMGTEKAARVADMMQTVARLLVLVIIIPCAIWLAVFSLLAGIIPDQVVRGLFSLTFGLGLAGIIVARMRYPVRGSILTTMAAAAGAVSLAIFWNQIFTNLLILHIFLITLLGIIRYLRVKLEISYFKWIYIRTILALMIIISAPLPMIYLLYPMGYSILLLATLTCFDIWFYSLGTQYLLREARFGIINSFLPAIGVSLLLLESHIASSPEIYPFVTTSVFLLGFGASYLFSTQVFRFIQRAITLRPTKKFAVDLKREDLLRSVGIEIESEKQLVQQKQVEDAVWLIDRNHAQILSGISLLILASGIPAYFMWLVTGTSWINESLFLFLFAPLAILLTLLVVVPAPVMFRLAGVLKRSQESRIVKALGLLIVSVASFGLFIWMQFYLISLAIPMSIILFISGITGIFKEIRLLWRAAWLRISSTLRRIWTWVRQHYIIAGIVSDGIITGLILVVFLYPYSFASNMHQPLLFLIASSSLIFTLLGLVGISGIRTHPMKQVYTAGGFSALLLSLFAISYWYLSGTYDFYTAYSVASIWFICFGFLQAVKVSRKAISIPFAIGVIGFALNMYALEVQVSSYPFPLLSIGSILVVSGILLHREYMLAFTAFTHALSIIGQKMMSALRKIGNAIKGALLRIGSTIKYALIRIGGYIYRGAVWLGVQIVRFVLVLYALVLLYFIGQFGYGFIISTPEVDFLFLLSGLTLAFFILYTPSLLFKGIKEGRILLACILTIAFAFGILVFSLTSAVDMFIRVPFAVFLTLLILTSVRSRMHEKLQASLPVMTWMLFVSWFSAYVYQSFLPDFLLAISVSLFMAGAGCLPLRLNKKLVLVSSILYILLAIPAGTFVIFMLSDSNIFLTCFALGLFPAVIFYKQYIAGLRSLGHALVIAGNKMLDGLRYLGGRIAAGFHIIGHYILVGLRRIGSALAMAARYLLLVLATHFIIAVGLVSLCLTSFVLYYFLPILQILQFWEIQFILYFLLLSSIIWLPAVFLRRKDYERVLILSLALFAFAIGGISFLAFLIDFGLINSALLSFSFSAMIFGIGVPSLRRRNLPIVLSLASLLFFAISILSFDLLFSFGVSVVGLAFLSVPFLSTKHRWRIIYPIISVTILGSFFYSIVLPITGPLLAITSFALMETLFLMLPTQTRSWQIWWVFCFSSGYVLYSLIALMVNSGLISYLQFIIPVFAAIELLRVTPDIEYRFSEYSEILSIGRAGLLSLALFVILPTDFILISAQLTAFIFVSIICASLWSQVSLRTRFISLNITACSLSLLSGTYFILMRGFDVLISYYFAVIPILISLVYSAYLSEQKQNYWLILRALITVSASLVWYTGYRTIESLALGIPTALFTGSLVSARTPWSGIPQQGISKFLCYSTVVFIESVWIWHALLILLVPSPLFLVISSILLISSIIFPFTKNLSWIDFELVWDGISILTGITLGGLLSDWNLALLALPSNPLLTLGWGLSIFSLMSGSMIRYNEAAQGEPASEWISHKAWALSIPGWTLIGFSYSLVLGNTAYILGITALSFSAASIVYAAIHPQPSRTLHLVVNITVAVSLSYFAWIWLELIPLIERFSMTLLFWLILEIPTLGRNMYSGLHRMYSFVKLNSVNFALVLPIIVGVWFGTTFLFQASCPLLLGLDVRPCFQAISVAAVSIGIMYFIEGIFLNGSISNRVRTPSVALLGRGILILLLSYTLPEAFPDFELVLYLVAGSITFSLITMTAINLIYGFKKAANRSWMFAGFTMLPATYLGLTRFTEFAPILVISTAVVLTFIMETPFLRSQIAAAIAMISRFARSVSLALRNLGATISRVIRRFAYAVKVFFERFGYINWVAFSLIFTTGLSYFSGTFFCDILGMNQLSILYWMPRFSMPILILGLLLLTVAIIRRTVRTTFGVSCVLIALAGGSMTATTWLFEHGFVLLAIATGMILICFGGLSVLFERKADGKLVSLLWIPIPASVGLVIINFLGTSTLALTLSFMFTSLILLLSTYTRLLAESLRDRLWVVTAATSGLATYTISLIGFQPLASLYLAVFVTSWILFPVTFKISKYLFVAPLFFALTGFAFTSLMGEFFQGLALALSPFLLFIALFIKEHESERPRLAYVRLALLLILLGSIAIFGISMVPFLIQT